MLDGNMTKYHTEYPRAEADVVAFEREHEPKRRFTLQEAIETESPLVPESIKTLFAIVLREHPELGGTQFEVAREGDKRCSIGSYDILEREDGMPLPVIFLDTEDLSRFQRLIDKGLLAVKMNAEQLGLHVDEMTPELLRLFIVSHELGHIHDFVKNYLSDPDLDPWEALDEMDDHRDASMRFLPGGGLTPRDFADRIRDAKTIEEAVDRVPAIRNHPRFGEIDTVEGWIDLQDEEYRTSPPESYADHFAARLILRHADIFLPQREEIAEAA